MDKKTTLGTIEKATPEELAAASARRGPGPLPYVEVPELEIGERWVLPADGGYSFERVDACVRWQARKRGQRIRQMSAGVWMRLDELDAEPRSAYVEPVAARWTKPLEIPVGFPETMVVGDEYVLPDDHPGRDEGPAIEAAMVLGGSIEAKNRGWVAQRVSRYTWRRIA